MNKHDIADALREISKYLEMKGENRFKVGAYARAADAVEATDEDIEMLVERERLTEIDGVGKGTASVIVELFRTGQSSYLEELRAEIPRSLLELAVISGVGPRKAMQVYAELGVETVDDLRRSIEDGSLTTVSGFGTKTVERVREGVETFKASRSKVLLPMALEVASDLASRVGTLASVQDVKVAGEVRRRTEVVSRIDLVVASKQPDQAVEDLLNGDLIGKSSRAAGNTLTGTVRPSLETRIVVVRPEELDTTLFRETGSKDFLNALAKKHALRIDEDGVRISGSTPKTEEDLFSQLGQPYIGPELRETAEIISRGIDPWSIISREDLRGTFHAHSTWSDGKASLEEMIRGAEELGLEYLGISDHSKSAGYAGGLAEDRVHQQHAEIRKLQKRTSITIFRGTECDILVDGSMDYDDETLAEFDFVIASVHSRFSMPPDEMSDRIISAITNPYVTFVGHLTGRKLLIRDGYSVEFDRVFDAAAEHGVVIEINGNPRRQDLDWRQMRNALDRGVMFSINPDAHSVAALDHITTGVWNARRGLVPREAVLNTKSVEEIQEYLEERRPLADSL